jgi:hypothetical protein
MQLIRLVCGVRCAWYLEIRRNLHTFRPKVEWSQILYKDTFCIKVKGKGKFVPLQAGTGLEGE